MEPRPHHPREQDFELLGIQPGTTLEQAKKAYRKLAKKWHPDRYQNAPDEQRSLAEARFREITDAYHRVIETLETDWRQRPEPGPEPARHHSEPRPEPSPKTKSRQAARPHSPRRRQQKRQKRQKRQEKKPPPAVSKTKDAVFTRLSAWRGRLLAGKRLYYAGLSLGVLLMGLGLFLLTRTNPVTRVVIPSLDDDRYVLLLPNQPATSRKPPTATEPRDIRGKQAARPQTVRPTGNRASFFSLGSTPEEVSTVQGSPTRIVGNAWSYGLSEVRFREGKVWSYNNFDGTLKIRLLPAHPCPRSRGDYFTLGATKDEVICTQGTPTRVEGNRWYYGFDEVRFRHGKVVGFNNTYGNLRIRIVPGKPSRAAREGRTFRLGADRDQVLAVQGTPRSVRSHVWYYSFADIVFVNGRVRWVNDPTHRLCFSGIASP